MGHYGDLATNSSDENSHCSVFDDDCDSDMNKWFETFFYNVDQAVFYDKKLSENYEKVGRECKVWNSPFKFKKVDPTTDDELKRTIFTTEKLARNKSRLVDDDTFDPGKYQLMKNKEKPIAIADDDDYSYLKPFSKKASKSKLMNPYYDMNDKFDKITLLNQIKQDYIRKHVLNSSNNKSEGNTGSHLPLMHNSNVLFPINSNNNSIRRRQSIDQNKMNDESISRYLYFFPGLKKDNQKKKSVAESKSKIQSIKSIMKIDNGNTSNLILNSQQFIQPKSPLILPPIMNRHYDLPFKFDKVTIRDQKNAILSCNKMTNHCSLNHLRRSNEFNAYNPTEMLSITNEYVHDKN